MTARRPIRLIKRSEMAKNFTMSEAIDCMSFAFAKLSSGDSYVPKRYIISTKDDSLNLFLKPAFINDKNTSSIKILTQKNHIPIPGIPTILGIVLLIDNVTGEILSIMDGEYITAMRTGAASGLATKYLSRKDSSKLAIFGCGSQGKTQLEAVDAVRDLDKIWIFDQSPEIAENFLKEMSCKTKATIEISKDLSVLKEVDIICTATNSESPLFYKEHLKSGVHINAIGSYKPNMQELDPEIIISALSYFDDKNACICETGDFQKAIESPQFSADNIAGEIGECILEKIKGRLSSEQITIFKSVGTAIQDLVVADRIFSKSLEEDFGQEIKLYE